MYGLSIQWLNQRSSRIFEVLGQLLSRLNVLSVDDNFRNEFSNAHILMPATTSSRKGTALKQEAMARRLPEWNLYSAGVREDDLSRPLFSLYTHISFSFRKKLYDFGVLSIHVRAPIRCPS